jgi:hypothetical protein
VAVSLLTYAQRKERDTCLKTETRAGPKNMCTAR